MDKQKRNNIGISDSDFDVLEAVDDYALGRCQCQRGFHDGDKTDCPCKVCHEHKEDD